MTLETSTRPLPVIAVLPPETTTEAQSASSRPAGRSGLRMGLGLGLGVGLVAVIALNWHLLLGALTSLAIVCLLAVFVVCVLFRIATGGRLGSAALGALVTALFLRRSR